MPVDVTTETTIARPREAVAAYAVDPDRVTSWYANIEWVEWVTPPPLAVGTRLRFVARFLGRRLVCTYEVRELVAGERLVMATREGPFPMQTTYAFADAPGGGTRMVRNRGEPAGLAGLAAPLVAAGVRRATRKDLARLTTLLEGGA